MPVSTLFRAGVDRYIAEARRQAGWPWIFIHIPKTAGTSLKNDLRQRFPRYKNIYLLPEEYRQVTEGMPFHDALAQKLAEQVEAFNSGGIDIASGHLAYRTASKVLESVPRHRLMTFLRDPVDRIISDYRYSMSPEHPSYREFAARYPSFEDYLKDEGECNKLCAYLQAEYDEPPLETAVRMERSFAFIGMQEQYESFLRLFWIVNDLIPTRVSRDNQTRNAAVSKENLQASRAAAEAANAKDMVVYNYFRQRYAAILDRLP